MFKLGNYLGKHDLITKLHVKTNTLLGGTVTTTVVRLYACVSYRPFRCCILLILLKMCWASCIPHSLQKLLLHWKLECMISPISLLPWWIHTFIWLLSQIVKTIKVVSKMSVFPGRFWLWLTLRAILGTIEIRLALAFRYSL